MDQDEYRKLAHAVQSGVGFDKDKTAQEPKHLRTGIDITKAEQAGLAQLLMDKGVFTLEEYEQAILQGLRNEVDRYERYLAEQYGTHKVSLL